MIFFRILYILCNSQSLNLLINYAISQKIIQRNTNCIFSIIAQSNTSEKSARLSCLNQTGLSGKRQFF